jgi:hypothetical protein
MFHSYAKAKVFLVLKLAKLSACKYDLLPFWELCTYTHARAGQYNILSSLPWYIPSHNSGG